jgi:hypothetical protein
MTNRVLPLCTASAFKQAHVRTLFVWVVEAVVEATSLTCVSRIRVAPSGVLETSDDGLGKLVRQE